MVSDRRLRKALDRMQVDAAATYDKGISYWFQPGTVENFRKHGLHISLTTIHSAGMREVRHHHPTTDVGCRLLMEGACFDVLARRTGKPARVLAPEVIYALAIERFKANAKEFSESWHGDFRAMSMDELGMCFTYAMHGMISDVGPWPGSDEELWMAWHRAIQQWLAHEARQDSNAIVLAAGNHPDPNEALAHAASRRPR